jgi:transcriptional regulator NrdR family protein
VTCPKCGAQQERVIDSRGTDAGTVIRRRRQCDGCQHRWTTHERIEPEIDVERWHARAKAIAAELRAMATALERW